MAYTENSSGKDTIKMSLPAEVQSYSFSAITPQQLATTSITFSILSVHQIPKDGSMTVRINSN
jgi:hypothetical protein